MFFMLLFYDVLTWSWTILRDISITQPYIVGPISSKSSYFFCVFLTSVLFVVGTQTILLQDKQQKNYCVSCQELDSDVDKDNPGTRIHKNYTSGQTTKNA